MHKNDIIHHTIIAYMLQDISSFAVHPLVGETLFGDPVDVYVAVNQKLLWSSSSNFRLHMLLKTICCMKQVVKIPRWTNIYCICLFFISVVTTKKFFLLWLQCEKTTVVPSMLHYAWCILQQDRGSNYDPLQHIISGIYEKLFRLSVVVHQKKSVPYILPSPPHAHRDTPTPKN